MEFLYHTWNLESSTPQWCAIICIILDVLQAYQVLDANGAGFAKNKCKKEIPGNHEKSDDSDDSSCQSFLVIEEL